MRTRRIAVVVSCLTLLHQPVHAAEYKAEYKLSVVVGPTGPWGEGAARFAEQVRKDSGGRINIKPYFSGQLFAGKQTNEFLLLRQGVADFALASTINWSSTIRELNLFSLPFFFPDYDALDAVEQGAAGKRIVQVLEEKGAVALAWGENGFRELTNSKRAVRTPDDLAGLKVRVVGSPIFIDTFKAMGANPISMNWGEALTAFQQGTVDGQENPVVSVLIPSKIWQVHKHLTVWRYAIDPLILAACKSTWNRFSQEDQALIAKAALESCRWEKEAARKGLKGGSAALDELRRNGMEVTVLTPEQVNAFRDRTRSVHEKWVKEVGPELVELARKSVEGAKK